MEFKMDESGEPIAAFGPRHKCDADECEDQVAEGMDGTAY
jgi:hypothetical protein